MCKKIFNLLMVLVLGCFCASCAKLVPPNNMPKPLTQTDLTRMAEVSDVFGKCQYALVSITPSDMSYAIRYFDHFVEVLQLAKIKNIVIKIDDLGVLDIDDSDNEKFLNFVNLLHYKGVNVIFRMRGELILGNVTANLTQDEENKLIEDAHDEIELVKNFLESFDDKSRIASLMFELDMPNILAESNQVKKNSLLSLYRQNGYGLDKDNELAYQLAIKKLQILKRIFELEQLIWTLDGQTLPKNLLSKIFDRRLSFEVLNVVDLVAVESAPKNFVINSQNLSMATKVEKAVIIGDNLTAGKAQSWSAFSSAIVEIGKKSQNNVGFGGLWIINYSSFYHLWRNN